MPEPSSLSGAANPVDNVAARRRSLQIAAPRLTSSATTRRLDVWADIGPSLGDCFPLVQIVLGQHESPNPFAGPLFAEIKIAEPLLDPTTVVFPQGLPPGTADGPRSRPHQRAWVSVEKLEQRVLLTIVFTPQFGAEATTFLTGNPAGSVPPLKSPPVYLEFWGSYWNSGTGPAEQAQIVAAAQTLFSTPFFSGQSQYGTDGNIVYGGVDNYTGTNPVNAFTGPQLQSAIQNSPNFLAADAGPVQPLYAARSRRRV